MDRKAEEEPIAELLATTTTPRGALRRLCSQPQGSRLKIRGTRPRSGSRGAGMRSAMTARNIDRGGDVKIAHAQCSMANLYSSEMAGRVADRAVQVFGGRGYMRENVAERFFRELRVERIWEGTSAVQRSIIADQKIKSGTRALTLLRRLQPRAGPAPPDAS